MARSTRRAPNIKPYANHTGPSDTCSYVLIRSMLRFVSNTVCRVPMRGPGGPTPYFTCPSPRFLRPLFPPLCPPSVIAHLYMHASIGNTGEIQHGPRTQGPPDEKAEQIAPLRLTQPLEVPQGMDNVSTRPPVQSSLLSAFSTKIVQDGDDAVWQWVPSGGQVGLERFFRHAHLRHDVEERGEEALAHQEEEKNAQPDKRGNDFQAHSGYALQALLEKEAQAETIHVFGFGACAVELLVEGQNAAVLQVGLQLPVRGPGAR